MAVSNILASIDREIELLHQARALLTEGAFVPAKKPVGRPRKTPIAIAPAPAKSVTRKKKRNLTPEGRKRIAEAVKRRWEAQKKSAA